MSGWVFCAEAFQMSHPRLYKPLANGTHHLCSELPCGIVICSRRSSCRKELIATFRQRVGCTSPIANGKSKGSAMKSHSPHNTVSASSFGHEKKFSRNLASTRNTLADLYRATVPI